MRHTEHLPRILKSCLNIIYVNFCKFIQKSPKKMLLLLQKLYAIPMIYTSGGDIYYASGNSLVIIHMEVSLVCFQLLCPTQGHINVISMNMQIMFMLRTLCLPEVNVYRRIMIFRLNVLLNETSYNQESICSPVKSMLFYAKKYEPSWLSICMYKKTQIHVNYRQWNLW